MTIIIFPGPHGASVHYRPDLLTPEQKARGIELAALPTPEPPAGKYAVLMGDKGTGQVWYEYKDIPPEPLEERVARLEQRVGQGVEIAADKTQIIANGTDFATVTATVPDTAPAAYVMVNGPPSVEMLPAAGTVEFEVSVAPEDAGLVHVEVATGGRKNFVILKAVV